MTKTTLQHLSQLNRRFIHNYVTNDVASHDAILHPHFQYINARGARIDRQNYLKAWATGFDADLIPYWDLRDEHILLRENVALVSAANKYVELENNIPVVGMAAYTDVYLLEAGQWLCLQAQITGIAEAHWPSDEKIICSYINGILQNPTSIGVS